MSQAPSLLSSTMDELPGLTVRSRNACSDIGAGFKGLVGGEVRGLPGDALRPDSEVTAYGTAVWGGRAAVRAPAAAGR